MQKNQGILIVDQKGRKEIQSPHDKLVTGLQVTRNRNQNPKNTLNGVGGQPPKIALVSQIFNIISSYKKEKAAARPQV